MIVTGAPISAKASILRAYAPSKIMVLSAVNIFINKSGMVSEMIMAMTAYISHITTL